MMSKIKKIIFAPQFDDFLQTAQSQPIAIEQDIEDGLRLLYDKMKGVAVSGSDDYREIWFHIERGSIKDFGNYKEYMKEGVVSNRADFENLWLSDYPESLKWYKLATNEYRDEYYFYIDGKLTFQISKEKPEYFGKINTKPLIDRLSEEISRCVDWLQNNEEDYNRYVNENLSFSRRTGKILRQKLWEISTYDKKQILKGLRKADINLLKKIVKQSTEDAEQNYLPEMTSGKFFDFCRLGYIANNYFKGKELTSLEMYKAFADGRHEGLTKIDPDSVEAFAEWYRTRSGGGHPWEICRGGNSTHISLYVERRNSKWRLYLAGSSVVRVNETVKFALAFYRNQIPFILGDAEEIYNMVCGTDYIGIVPQEYTPRYCHSLFEDDDERIIDFMNLGWEETDKIIPAAEWYPIVIKARK